LSDRSSDIAAALAEAARTINTPGSYEQTLRAIVEAAPGTVPGFSHVSVTAADRSGNAETTVGSDERVIELDQRQYDAGEGPCFDAIRVGGALIIDDIRHEQRWPRYIAEAIPAGVTAQIGVQLHHAGRTLGALNLYKTTGPGVDADTLAIAQLFATHAALALAHSRTEEHLTRPCRPARPSDRRSASSWSAIRSTRRGAFAFLVRASTVDNIKLRDVAQELVVQTELRYGEESA